MTTSCDFMLSAALSSRNASIGMRLSAPSSEKRLCPTYFVCRKCSNASAAFSRSSSRSFSSCETTRSTPSTRSWIQRFSSASWMCMYSMPTVPQYAARRTSRISRSVERCLPRETVGEELAVEVPHPEAPVRGIELDVAPRLAHERVEVGDEMSADAVDVDQLQDARAFLIVAGSSAVRELALVAHPPHRLVRDVQRLEQLVVEAVLALEQRLDGVEELAGLGPLDDRGGRTSTSA